MSVVFSRMRWYICAGLALALILYLAFLPGRHASAAAAAPLQISSDPYTNATSQHQTEVEPDSFSYGSTIVAATQVGRFTDGGSSNIGWATSTDNGLTWQHGFLPGTTPYSTPTGSYDRLSDPTVAYDAAHKQWIIASLAVSNTGITPSGVAVIVSISSDGGLTWNAPVIVANANGGFFDKDWIVCDNTTSSPYYGHCYVQWDITSSGNLVQMSTSTNGGSTWSAGQATANNVSGLGGQPLVQPNGTVIVPFLSSAPSIAAFTSTNGGTSWNASVTISSQTDHAVTSLRTEPLPSAEIDGAGKVYVVWQDCRFESGCTANDLLMSTSSDGTTWSAAQQIPLDAVGSGVDHFIPGIAVDPTTSSNTAHLALTYYYYPDARCTQATCQLEVGFATSVNGGSTWSTKTTLTSSPIPVTWLANTSAGYMVGDYISTSFANGKAIPVFEIATAPNNGQFNEFLSSVAGGLAVTGGANEVTSGKFSVLPSFSVVLRTAF